MAALLAGAFSIMPTAQALPTGGASATANISVNGDKMNITSAVANNLLTWHDFSINQGQEVAFGGSNTYLNVVTGANRSLINGILSGANANVYLVNPYGIIIGETGSINVGSLHLSTADISGKLGSFDTALGAVNAATTFVGDVVNKGKLTSASGITVDGTNITFKNVADVSSTNVTLKSTNAAHLGHAIGSAATAVIYIKF